MSPARFAELASKGRWYCAPHLALLNERLMDVATGIITRQATFMPPRHGKSLFRSMYFPAWYLGTFPDRRVILASYNADFAAEWGQKVRDLLELEQDGERIGEKFFGIRVRQDRRASDNWGIVGHDGGMQTCGVGGGLTGRGADLLLIDDPVKDADEAMSPTLRQRNWDWYASAADTRLEPGGAVCLTMTPWHGDDLGGRILEREHGLYDVLRLPALPDEPVEAEKRAQRKGYDFYVGAPDPLNRAPGEALWPRRYDVAFFDRKKKQDPFWFDALFNCSPRPRDGNIFKRWWFDGKTIAVPHREARHVRYWDTAASLNKGDYTVGVLMGEHNGLYYVEHVERFRLDPGGRDARIRDVAFRDKERYGFGLATWIEQGGGGGGKTEAAGIIKALAGFVVQVESHQTNKAARAVPFASQCEAGNVKVVAGKWNEPYLDELCAFAPDGACLHDDQVDASSGAFNKLALGDDGTGGYCSMNEAEYALMEGFA
jgi:predicted phage terminase large subunit-like protein